MAVAYQTDLRTSPASCWRGPGVAPNAADKMPRCRKSIRRHWRPQVLWAAFGLSVVLGAIMQRTHFCTMGAVADIVNMGDWTRMRMWVMAMGVAMIGFNAMVALGWLDAVEEHLRRAALHLAVGAGRRRAVRLRHGAGVGLRQQDAGAHRQRQPEVAGRLRRARHRRVRDAEGHHRGGARRDRRPGRADASRRARTCRRCSPRPTGVSKAAARRGARPRASAAR